MKPENVSAFVNKFESVVADTIQPHMLVPEIEVDAEIKLKDIKHPFFNILKQFEPFGPANMRPVFITRHVYDYKGYSRVVKDQHLRFVIHQHGGITMDGIGFMMADKYPFVQQGAFDIVYTLDENDYNGRVTLQMKVIDIRPAE